MFPWFWLWCPQLHFPLSGSVVQDIAPDLDAFFAGIPPGAGSGRIEQAVFREYSYGKQLGLILDLLLPLAESGGLDGEVAQQALAELRRARERIAQIKADSRDQLEASAQSLLQQLDALDRPRLERLLAQFAG